MVRICSSTIISAFSTVSTCLLLEHLNVWMLRGKKMHYFLFFQANGPRKEWRQPNRDWERF